MASEIKYSDINKNKLISLKNYSKEQQEILIDQAVKENILFYIIFVNGRLLIVDMVDLVSMMGNPPEK